MPAARNRGRRGPGRQPRASCPRATPPRTATRVMASGSRRDQRLPRQENVGPLELPSNWARSPGPAGLRADQPRAREPRPAGDRRPQRPLNTLAAAGAASGNDPVVPGGRVRRRRRDLGRCPSVLAADYLWMYADGPGGNNLDCGSASRQRLLGPPRHHSLGRKRRHARRRRRLLERGGTISSAYVVLSGYSTGEPHLHLGRRAQVLRLQARPSSR